VLTVLVETIIDLAIEGDLLIRVNASKETSDGSNLADRKMPVYLGIFAFAQYVLLPRVRFCF
jgi:hypothetical protein